MIKALIELLQLIQENGELKKKVRELNTKIEELQDGREATENLVRSYISNLAYEAHFMDLLRKALRVIILDPTPEERGKYAGKYLYVCSPKLIQLDTPISHPHISDEAIALKDFAPVIKDLVDKNITAEDIREYLRDKYKLQGPQNDNA